METLAERLLKAREQRELNEYGRVLSEEERDKLIDEEDAKREREARESRLAMNLSQFMASVPPRFKEATFDNYECQTEKQLKVLDFLRLGKSAIIYGSNGTGKTHIAYASCKHQIAQGKTAGYTLAFDFFNKIRQSFGDGSTEQLVNRFIAYDYLVIDEIDKTQGTPTEFNYLYHLINQRYNYMRSTVLITNSKPDEFGAIMGQSVLDRVASEGKVIDLTGDNYRQKRSKQ
jgi:DNA replication protein DnaC